MKIQSTLIIGGLALLAVSCDLLEDAKVTVNAEIQNRIPEQVSINCDMYRERFAQTGDSSLLAAYNQECQDQVIEVNMPENLDLTCQTKYAEMLSQSDAVILAMQGTCTQENRSTDPACLAAQATVDSLALAFQAECGTASFYYPTLDEVIPNTEVIEGQCVWQAWIPEQTRLADQDSMVTVICTEAPPTCSDVEIQGVIQNVETHTSLDGSVVFLPCIQVRPDSPLGMP